MAPVNREDGMFLPVCFSFSAWFNFEMHSCRCMDMDSSCILWRPQLHTHMHHSPTCLMYVNRFPCDTGFLCCSLWALSLANDIGHLSCFQEHLLSAHGLHVRSHAPLSSCNIYMKQLILEVSLVRDPWLPVMQLGTESRAFTFFLCFLRLLSFPDPLFVNTGFPASVKSHSGFHC